MNCMTIRRRNGFTLIELLVVIVVVVMLGAFAVSVSAGARSNSKAAQCLNNLRRLTGAWQMYASDNADRMITNPTWVAGVMDWNPSPDNTNWVKLIDPAQSPIARYVQAADLFKCPADRYTSPFGPRVRSISLNAALGGTPIINQGIPGRTYFAARKVSELNKPGPASTIVLLDEHPDSINDATFYVAEGLQPSGAQWIDLPASYHGAGCGVAFADGRSIIKRWQDPRTMIPVAMLPPWDIFASPNNLDYVWINDRMPYR